jgi:hypothetical protein
MERKTVRQGQPVTELMMKFFPLLAMAALAAASPALSQTTTTDNTGPSAVANANRSAGAQAQYQTNMNAADQARYQEDRAAYIAALRARHHDAVVTAEINERQERAYADAMYAWRVQVADCKHGRRAACNAPTPDPANFW